MPQQTVRILAVSAALGVAAWGWTVLADGPNDGPRNRPEGRSAQDGPPRRPAPPPLEIALDQNQDHEIDADELEAATANLKKLDKNGDGKLTPEEYRPPRPDPMARGPRDGQGPPRGPRDGEGPRRQRGPRDGDGAKGDGNCPDKSQGDKPKTPGQKDE